MCSRCANPGLVRVNFIIENQGVEEASTLKDENKLKFNLTRYVPGSSVDTIEDRDHKRRVIYFEPAIKTDDLGHGCGCKKDDREYTCGMCKL